MDFKEEALKHKDDLLKDLKELCQIPSTMDLTTASEGQPFGKEPRVALDHMINIGKRDGFVTDNCDGYAGSIDIGEGEKVFGILGHLDVVPVNPTGWHYPKFDCTLDHGMLYGRGVADDKGPLLAAYYAAKIVNAMDFEKKMKIRVIFGTNEENGSRCVQYYFKHRPYPDEGITPDADFPVVYGEKAIARISATGHFASNGLISLKAGTVVNVVPEEAVAVVDIHQEDLQQQYDSYLRTYGLEGSIEPYHGKTKVTLKGVSAHGSMPELGKNALVYLAGFLAKLIPNDLLQFINEYFFEDVNGEKLGVAYKGHMGVVTCNLGILDYEDSKAEMDIDFRLPHEIKEEELISKLKNIFESHGFTISYDWTNALFIDPKSELIQKLHQSYVEYTGDHTHGPQCIGGGTYAKEMPNCVAFGAEFPGRNNGMHQNDEHILLDDLLTSVAIYASALYNIIKK